MWKRTFYLFYLYILIFFPFFVKYCGTSLQGYRMKEMLTVCAVEKFASRSRTPSASRQSGWRWSWRNCGRGALYRLLRNSDFFRREYNISG